MLEHLGSLPDGPTEWHCTECDSNFVFAQETDEGEIEPVIDPVFCPICGE